MKKILSLLLVSLLVLFLLTSWKAPSRQKVLATLSLEGVDTGWTITDRMLTSSKIVPRITFRVKNKSTEAISKGSLYFTVTFRLVGDRQAFDSNWSPYPPEDIFPGAMSAPLNILSLHGYKGSSPDSYLKNKAQWQKMEAEVFVRMRGSAFYSLGTWPIAQKIDGWTETPAPATPAPEDALPAKTESAPEERPAS